MGVKGLWEVLQPTAKAVPLTRLSLDALKANKDGYRALRIGIDASLWVFHAKSVPQSGLNPFIRTLFFKILKLLQYPILLLFVFDGPHKPAMKRGNKVGGRFGRGDRESMQFKLLLDEMGLEYWDAPGEAEAELAQFNSMGLIDAVLTDDVDALVFGATCVLRNPSRGLSGNASNLSSALPLSESREDYQVYRKEEIANANLRKNKDGEEDTVSMDVDGMILLALLVGGDYHPAGMPSCGPKIAMGLVQAGLGKELLTAYRTLPSEAFETYLQSFVESLRQELTTNAHGFLPGKRKALASKIPADFPSREVLEYYAKPRVSPPHEAWPGFGRRALGSAGAGFRGGRGDPRAWARACERFFEWGSKEEVGKRFRTLVWRGEVVQAVREKLGAPIGEAGFSPGEEAPRTKDQGSSSVAATGRPRTLSSYFASQSRGSASRGRTRSPLAGHFDSAFPAPRLKDIHGKRAHIATGHTAEYRVEYDPSEWNRLIQDSMDGTRLQSTELTAEERQALDMVAAPGTGSTTSEAGSSSALSEDDTVATPRRTRQKKQVDLDSNDKVWIPVEIIQLGFPEWEQTYLRKLRDKEEASKTPKKRAPRAATQATQRSPKNPARAKAATSSQQATVTNWFDSGKPSTIIKPSTPVKPLKMGMASKTRASKNAPIEIIDLSDSPEPPPRSRASSVGSAVIAIGTSIIEIGSSSPMSTGPAGKDKSEVAPHPSNLDMSDTSGDESSGEGYPEWLHASSKPRSCDSSPDATPKIRTRSKPRNVVSSPMRVDTPPPAKTHSEARVVTTRHPQSLRIDKEHELTPTAMLRVVRQSRQDIVAGSVEADAVESLSHTGTSVIQKQHPQEVRRNVSPINARPSMARKVTRKARLPPAFVPTTTERSSLTEIALASTATTMSKDTPPISNTLMGYFKPAAKSYVPIPKAKPTVYRLVKETEEAEYYMPDYA
ncbi:hypothetical protein NliqN6_5849 [Naganishia liquefaciens]|uniref:XPG-I domain-containing protein n=1 Tax=Naganishia liquefaciens TaxID=104408 RepID=A0A8H3TYI4_9TREE|nr:hypothetical protein NliqN6_5849 [Naganishia liquefaciens]